MSKTLYMVVPCYNEQEVLPETAKRLLEKLQSLVLKNKIADNSRIMFVNDGSKDQTWSMIKGLCEENSVFAGVNLSRNRGHQNALLAGMATAVKYADMIVTMDADLQDPPSLLPDMYRILKEEPYDSVATRRSTRMGEPKIRSFLSKEFYNVINKISKTEIVSGARDYRLMNRKMVDAVLEMSEYNRFSKGIFGWVGFRTKWLEYENIERSAGETKWNVKKLFIYSLEGITGFSVVPLSIAAYMGVLFCGLSFLMIVAIVVRTLIWGDPVAGWPSMVCILFGVGGVQLLCTGILGQYLAKTYLEVKNRPVYLLKDSSKEEQRIMMMPLSQNLRRKSYGQG